MNVIHERKGPSAVLTCLDDNNTTQGYGAMSLEKQGFCNQMRIPRFVQSIKINRAFSAQVFMIFQEARDVG